MNQHQKILNLLESGNWVCSSKMYAEYIADPRTRLVELKKKGYNLISRWCLSHHHDGQMKEWRLITSEINTAPKFDVEKWNSQWPEKQVSQQSLNI